MRFELEVQTEDDDATTDPTGLLCWLLLGVSTQIANGKTSGLLVDRNGNRVGSWVMSTPDEEEDEDNGEQD